MYAWLPISQPGALLTGVKFCTAFRPHLWQVFSYFGGISQGWRSYGRQQGPYGGIFLLLKHLFIMNLEYSSCNAYSSDFVRGDWWLYFPVDLVFPQNHSQAGQSLAFVLLYTYAILNHRSLAIVIPASSSSAGEDEAAAALAGDTAVPALEAVKTAAPAAPASLEGLLFPVMARATMPRPRLAAAFDDGCGAASPPPSGNCRFSTRVI